MIIAFDMDIVALADTMEVMLSDPLGNEVVKQMVEILASSPFAGMDTNDLIDNWPSLWVKCIRVAYKRALVALTIYDLPSMPRKEPRRMGDGI